MSESNATRRGIGSLSMALTVVERLVAELALPVLVFSNTEDAGVLRRIKTRLGVDPTVIEGVARSSREMSWRAMTSS